MPTAYHYDPDTLVYANTSSTAEQDPLDPDRFLVPGVPTLLTPPHVGDPKKQHAVFRDGAWVVEEIPVVNPLKKNIEGHPANGLMWPRIGIQEALNGGVT